MEMLVLVLNTQPVMDKFGFNTQCFYTIILLCGLICSLDLLGRILSWVILGCLPLLASDWDYLMIYFIVNALDF